MTGKVGGHVEGRDSNGFDPQTPEPCSDLGRLVSFEMGPEPQACPVRFLFHPLDVADHPVLIQ
jgi:hypothetical protein